jgi:hypothetical protein
MASASTQESYISVYDLVTCEGHWLRHFLVVRNSV